MNCFCLRVSKQSPAPERWVKLGLPTLGAVAVAALARHSSESTWSLELLPLPSLHCPGALLSLCLAVGSEILGQRTGPCRLQLPESRDQVCFPCAGPGTVPGTEMAITASSAPQLT